MSRVAQANSQQSSFDTQSSFQSSFETNGPSCKKSTSQPQLSSQSSDYFGQAPVPYVPPGAPYMPANSEALTPFSLKTSITIPRQPKPSQPRRPSLAEKSQRPNHGTLPRQDKVIRQDSCVGGPQPYPDLARHPSSSSQAARNASNSSRFPLNGKHHAQPPNQLNNKRHSFVYQRTESSEFDYEHSRSSSVGDIHWGVTGDCRL